MSAVAAFLDTPLAIVDLETTGGHPGFDRITEIAVIEARLGVDEGLVTDTWSTLVNPGTTIPAAIQALTGITNAMVADAPPFAELADGLLERLDGRLFVAHNARFDYGFLRQAFERCGHAFASRTLCTVRLSRRLYPGHARHNLDSLIARHGLAGDARHRAMGDAEAVWQFLRIAAAEHGVEVFCTAARQVANQPTLPEHIQRAAVDAVPEAPGVYLFRGEGDVPLYVGKSVSMRSRVLGHFSGTLRSARETELARAVRRIEFRRTAGELGALLEEAALVKSLLPAFNRQLRRVTDLCGFVLTPFEPAGDAASRPLRLASAAEFDAASLGELRGVFRSKRAALAALRGLADKHRLCLQTLGFETKRSAQGACFRHQLARCAGACTGAESAAAHHARLAAALAGLQRVHWPHPGPIGIIEGEGDARAVHVVHQWCWLGTAQNDAEVATLLEGARRPQFDLDQHRILERHLARGKSHIVRLG